MEKTLDLSKPVQQFCGRKAVIRLTDVKGSRNLLVELEDSEGGWFSRFMYSNGTCFETASSPHDLVNVPEKRTLVLYFNCYPNGVLCDYTSRESADLNANDVREACIKRTIEYEVGQFDA